MPWKHSEPPWSTEDMPDLSDRHVVITGANSGIGFEAARLCAARGARVVLACRNEQKAQAALDQILDSTPSARAEFIPLNLASLASIHQCADRLNDRLGRIDLLFNNAGVMALPQTLTEDGFEMQIGTNHFGHFALTGRVLNAILIAPAGRIINVTSNAHKMGQINWEDIHGSSHYRPWPAYAQSKLANLLFTYALQRRLASTQQSAIAVAAHPGYSATNLPFVTAQMNQSPFQEALVKLGNWLIAQDATQGALPMLRAATAPNSQGGEYWGPRGAFEMTGAPVEVTSASRSHSRADQDRLWQMSVEQTGVDFSVLSLPTPSPGE
ncbi:MAG: oxidoreductase [Myxococcota bacterium]|nr:oxidoreductase [Myxococcota bacterium]